MAAAAGGDEGLAERLAKAEAAVEQLSAENELLRTKLGPDVLFGEAMAIPEALERYRARFAGKKSKPVKVVINGKVIKTRVYFGDAPLPRLVAPPRPSSGELLVREENAVTVPQRSTHQHAVLVPAGLTLRFEWTLQDSGSNPTLDVGFSLRKRIPRAADAGEDAPPPLGWRNLEELPWHGMQGSAEGSEVTRYSGEVLGQWGAALQECEVIFVWDNSYSWFKKKTIVFCADVVALAEEDQEGGAAAAPGSDAVAPVSKPEGEA